MTSDAANETASGKPPGPTTSKEKPGVEAAAAAAKETPSPPSEMLTPMGQAIQFAEKKIRNLEKRIAKLDGYKETARRGKPLNDDQKAAVAKYDEVMQTAEFARDIVLHLQGGHGGPRADHRLRIPGQPQGRGGEGGEVVAGVQGGRQGQEGPQEGQGAGKK